MKKPQVYVAGPYSGMSDTKILDNCAEALRAGLQLARIGFAPIVPHTMGSHRSTWDDAMERCRMIVSSLDTKRGDCVALLPGWENSRGAREEVAIANRLGIPVRPLEEVLQCNPS